MCSAADHPSIALRLLHQKCGPNGVYTVQFWWPHSYFGEIHKGSLISQSDKSRNVEFSLMGVLFIDSEVFQRKKGFIGGNSMLFFFSD